VETVKVHVWGNLKAMTEKGEIFKNYQTKTDHLESKISKNILVDCTFINSMQTIPLQLNVLQTIKQFKVLKICFKIDVNIILIYKFVRQN
jgi:hypothetical protein